MVSLNVGGGWWVEYRAIRFSPFANRLAYDGIPKKIQKLRCFTNFVALRFAAPIADIGNLLVRRMVAKSANTNGNYVAIHLRFEEVPVALLTCFDCQNYGIPGHGQVELIPLVKDVKGHWTANNGNISPVLANFTETTNIAIVWEEGHNVN